MRINSKSFIVKENPYTILVLCQLPTFKTLSCVLKIYIFLDNKKRTLQLVLSLPVIFIYITGTLTITP